MSQENVEVVRRVRRVYDLWNRGEFGRGEDA
jgi:hypothetical protein